MSGRTVAELKLRTSVDALVPRSLSAATASCSFRIDGTHHCPDIEHLFLFHQNPVEHSALQVDIPACTIDSEDCKLQLALKAAVDILGFLHGTACPLLLHRLVVLPLDLPFQSVQRVSQSFHLGKTAMLVLTRSPYGLVEHRCSTPNLCC